MSYAPQNLLDVREYIQSQTGLSDNELGIVGDEYHDNGYHLGRDRLPPNDYSNRLPRDKAGLTNAASASDIGNFSRLKDLTSFILDRCRDGRITQIRAINGPHFSGRAYRWDSQSNWEPQIKPKGDSHEWHAHLEWWRDTEYQDKVWMFREFFEGTGGDDAMFCRLGDKNDKVLAMQVMVVNAGGRVGSSADPYSDCDGQFGPNTSAGLSSVVGGNGDVYGPWQYAALHRRNSQPGPQGEPGVKGEKGDKGDPGTFVGATFTAVGTFTQGS